LKVSLLHKLKELYIKPSSEHERRFAKFSAGGQESWHAIKKLFKLPFLILNVSFISSNKLNYWVVLLSRVVIAVNSNETKHFPFSMCFLWWQKKKIKINFHSGKSQIPG